MSAPPSRGVDHCSRQEVPELITMSGILTRFGAPKHINKVIEIQLKFKRNWSLGSSSLQANEETDAIQIILYYESQWQFIFNNTLVTFVNFFWVCVLHLWTDFHNKGSRVIVKWRWSQPQFGYQDMIFKILITLLSQLLWIPLFIKVIISLTEYDIDLNFFSDDKTRVSLG